MSLQKDEELFKKPLEEFKKCLDAWASASRHFFKLLKRFFKKSFIFLQRHQRLFEKVLEDLN
jgi:hypothetical protein